LFDGFCSSEKNHFYFLSSDAFEDVVHETVKSIALLEKCSVLENLEMPVFQHLVDVDGIALFPVALVFAALRNVLLSSPDLLGHFTLSVFGDISKQF
jgi:hypothetical protein